jgi:hypothetical protein
MQNPIDPSQLLEDAPSDFEDDDQPLIMNPVNAMSEEIQKEEKQDMEDDDDWLMSEEDKQAIKLEKEFEKLNDELYNLEIQLDLIQRGLSKLKLGEKLECILDGQEGKHKEYAEELVEEWIEDREENKTHHYFISKKIEKIKKLFQMMGTTLSDKVDIFPHLYNEKLDNYFKLLTKKIPPLCKELSDVLGDSPSTLKPRAQNSRFSESDSDSDSDSNLKSSKATLFAGSKRKRLPYCGDHNNKENENSNLPKKASVTKY